MSDRYKGAILSPTAPTVTPQSAGGIYTSSQQLQYQGQGVWPTAFNNPINNSLRFRASASAYLSRTPTTTNRKTWTWSAWVKRGTLGTDQVLFGAYDNSSGTDATYTSIGFTASNTFLVGGWTVSYRNTTQVFRDPSAWYHLVVALDTTQATASNRVKVYVNGSEVTAFGGNNNPSQNADLGINLNQQHGIGRINYLTGSGPYYFDGYMAEINFIDGVALTPSSFGTTDAYGIWQPIPYTGAYGTNGFYLPFRLNSTSSFYGSFNGSSQYLTLPTSSAFSMGTGNFTVETFFNCAAASSNNVLLDQWQNASGSYTTGQWELQVFSNTLTMYIATGASSNVQLTASVSSNIWYHVAVVRNGTTVTMYLNGTAVSSATVSSAFGLSAYALTIGRETRSSSGYFSGQLSNTRITNTAVYTANFTPPTSPLTAVSGTQLLTLQNSTIIDNSTNAFSITNSGSVTTTATTSIFAQPTLTSDYSGNNNSWTQNNISLTPGSTYDSMTDVPTNTNSNTANYCVLNPIALGTTTLSDGNLKAVLSTTTSTTYSTVGVTTGKWYWEVTYLASTSNALSVGVNQMGNITTLGGSAGPLGTGGVGYYGFNGNKYVNGTGSSYGATFTTNDVIGVALDATGGTITFYKNNTSQGTISLPTLTSSWDAVFDNGSGGGTQTMAVNFGQQPFTYTPPSGFYPLNTYNLPTPTILDGDQYFNAVIYNGNGSTQTIATGFQPDFTWIKVRNVADDHFLYDSVRGATKYLSSNTTGAEGTISNGLTAFASTGFTLGDSGSTNNGSNNFASWSWRASNAAGVSNTQGTITSTVSANTTAGFSVVTYTGNGVTGATVGHGLGIAPSMIIVKRRSSTSNWNCYHASLGATKYIVLNLTDASYTDIGAWNNTAPTSSVFTLGSFSDLNTNGSTMVAYCFAQVSGYSAFGSYTGNGSTDGPFVYLGFRPRFVMTKNASASGSNWSIQDTSRPGYNVTDNRLFPNSSDAETSDGNGLIDINSNGFKIRTSHFGMNGSGNTIIYACFAENPFKISRAR